jgi:hypothetical protein
MAKPKKKLTAAQRAAKKQRKKDFMTVFMNGKQVRVRRPPTIDGKDEDEFIRQNADPIWLHQHGYHEILHEWETKENEEPPFESRMGDESDDVPF